MFDDECISILVGKFNSCFYTITILFLNPEWKSKLNFSAIPNSTVLNQSTMWAFLVFTIMALPRQMDYLPGKVPVI